ncbi:hypothetical protein [Pseudonocardia sp. WMMC193]|uniref:hypothetical protein n=1 Tax=Pseudonocardia sp. WMMC193 TaxID=2911965 RepID=UPI001F322F8C|nr:hypothetical protein [Pseudonocardia sp. WMMC193]MCF7552071.1 hypothetical protein [Pseudonocardia sp. WMMC193]
MAENVLVVTGSDPAEALSALRASDAIELRAAAIVHRAADGKLTLDEQTGDALTFADTHPRLGALVTLLLGPVDTLLFGNQLVALYGAAEQSEEGLALRHIAQAVPAGGSAVIADVVEDDESILDTAVPGTIARKPLAQVEREIDAGVVERIMEP